MATSPDATFVIYPQFTPVQTRVARDNQDEN